MTDLFMVFDVEATDLHGQGFAVGWVVMRRGEPKPLAEGIAVTLPEDEPTPWVRSNVLPHLPAATQTSVSEVRDDFWRAWQHWRDQGAWLAADVPWPVEARFLVECVEDDSRRAEGGPYPLVDIASVRLAAGQGTLGSDVRHLDELPAHNPLADARQSARLLMEALDARDARVVR